MPLVKLRRSRIENQANGAASPANQRSNGKGSPFSDTLPQGWRLIQRPRLVGEQPKSIFTETAWVGKVPIEVRLGPIRLRFHVRILPPWPDTNVVS